MGSTQSTWGISFEDLRADRTHFKIQDDFLEGSRFELHPILCNRRKGCPEGIKRTTPSRCCKKGHYRYQIRQMGRWKSCRQKTVEKLVEVVHQEVSKSLVQQRNPVQ